MTPVRLHSSYVAWFMGWNLWLATGDLLDLDWRIRLVGLLGFLATELVATAWRKKKGDSWSEILWSVLPGRPALIPPAIAWVVFFLWQWVEIFPGARPIEAWVGIPELGLLALLVGAGGWLVIHFPFGGRFG